MQRQHKMDDPEIGGVDNKYSVEEEDSTPPSSSENSNSRSTKIVNGHKVRPRPTTYPRIENYSRKSRVSSKIGYFLLILSNTILLILAVTFALLYFNSGTDANEENNREERSPSNFSCKTDTPLPEWNAPTPSLLGHYSRASVAADNELCSDIGRDFLLRGANAVEASIATLFCIGVMDTHSSGLGGGLFMTIYNATTQECYVIDARETAPLNSNENTFKEDPKKSQRGWEAVAVPGELHGLWTAYQKFGDTLDWSELVQPAAKRVEEGYPVSLALVRYLETKKEEILKYPQMAAVFTNPDTKELYTRGEQIKTRPNLAKTLKQLAEAQDPVELFYKGEMAKSMAEEFQKNGGRITLNDFANYKSLFHSGTDLIYTQLPGGRKICGPPPPSGSVVAQAILNILAPLKFDLKTFSGRTDFLHHYIEASKFAYAVRNVLGDKDFVPEAMETARNITTPEWGEFIRSKITSGTHDDAYYDEFGSTPYFQASDHGTSHVSVIDQWGNAVSVTSSINLAFGSFVFSESTGILWNDQMDDFSTPGTTNAWGYPPSPHNFIHPGKRPMSSMSPLIIFNKNGKEVLSIGGAGGSTIISGVAGSAFKILWEGMNIKEAIDFPRLHNQLRPNHTRVESRLPMEYVAALEQKGHRIQMSKNAAEYFNVVTGVHLTENGIFSNSDWRKGWESQPAGY